ncbi:MAG: VCBS repeat-containing protein [Fibrobacterota bacterium]|nr:VCBS repeat-containing protein [Fibrobacterota bacterium]
MISFNKTRIGSRSRIAICGLLVSAFMPVLAEMKFTHHVLITEYPNTGRYGQCGFADFDKDGKIDFFNGESYQTTGTPIQIWAKNNGTKANWNYFTLSNGTNGYNTGNAGATPHDADGDGWVDIVTSGTWYRNPGAAGVEGLWQRSIYDPKGANAHDIFAADINGDGKADIVTNPDNSTSGVKHGVGIEAGLWWYNITANGAGTWPKVLIGPSTHGGITPRGFGDIDGDGDLDVVNMGAWYENKDKGASWTEHKNLGFGRSGPIGVSGKTWVADIDKDGDLDVVQTEADLFATNAAAWLENADGKGMTWTKHTLPTTTEATADWHSLGVADFDRDGDLDILVVETEWETTTVRPRWFVWENMDGKGASYVRRVIFAGNMGGHESQIVDMDGDGDIDIISREHDPKSYNAVGGKKHIDWMENVTVPTTNLFLKNSPNKRTLSYQVNAYQSMDVQTVGEGAYVLEILDAKGKPMARANGKGIGRHSISIQGYSSGVYAVRVSSGRDVQTALVTLNL